MAMIGRANAKGLIPTDVSREILQGAIAESAVLNIARRLQDMSTNALKMPVLDSLPTAYFVNGEASNENSTAPDTFKQTTNMTWSQKEIIAEEIATIVIIHENVLKDSEYDIWGEVKPRLVEAFGRVIDSAILFGKGNYPTKTWRKNLVASAIEAGNAVTKTDSIFTDIMGENGLISKVENSGYEPNGVMGAVSMKGILRGVIDTTGRPIFENSFQGKAPFTLNGLDAYFPLNGAFDANEALLIVGDWSKLVYSIRQDIEYKLLDQAIMQDPQSGNITHNFGQQDLIGIRATMRLGWEIMNPLNAFNANIENPFPFAVYKKAASGSELGG